MLLRAYLVNRLQHVTLREKAEKSFKVSRYQSIEMLSHKILVSFLNEGIIG